MNLTDMHCNAEHASVKADSAQLAAWLPTLPGWSIDQLRLSRNFEFIDFFETMAFVNAVAWIAHQEDHHPDMEVHYNSVTLSWSTHDSGHLTLNDFICAAKCQALQGEYQ
jgi:4a-hydroxytetrahydrobiopterin dehydratase